MNRKFNMCAQVAFLLCLLYYSGLGAEAPVVDISQKKETHMKPEAVNERTFIIVKPDGVQRGMVGEIISRFEKKGMKLVAMKMLQITQDQAQRQYACHLGKPFYGSLVKFMTSGPSVAMVLEGPNAIKLARKIMGATDPASAEPGTIRGDFSINVEHNLVHGSDSAESFQHEANVYFSPSDFVGYDLSVKEWL